MENMDDRKILLKDDDGSEKEFELIMSFTIEEDEYVILAPLDAEDEEAVALKIVKDENGKDILLTIDNDVEFSAVQEAYETLCLQDD